MVRYRGRYLLFYSANAWESPDYAVGYARCAGPLGPCRKAGAPVLTSRGRRLGPGGASPFVGPRGRLYLAYHYWNAPYTSYPDFPACQADASCTRRGQRRLAVSEVEADRSGRLQVR
jgi:hypothetical protein